VDPQQKSLRGDHRKDLDRQNAKLGWNGLDLGEDYGRSESRVRIGR
jgi:hypothetical protein